LAGSKTNIIGGVNMKGKQENNIYPNEENGYACKYKNCISNADGKCEDEEVRKDKTKCQLYYKRLFSI
jgi:aspartate carbamoyltransferase regulatory subunit